MSIMDETRGTYETIGEDFCDTRDRVWPEMEELVEKYIRAGMRVLDAGCGNGRLVEILGDVNYLGIDGSKKLIEAAGKRFGKDRFRLLDMLSLGKLKGKFDVIFMFASFNHIPSRKLRLKVLRDARGLLVPGGLLIMSNWNLWQWGRRKSIWRLGWPLKRNAMIRWKSRDGKRQGRLYYRVFGLVELSRLLRRAGFRVVEGYYSLGKKRVGWLKGRNIINVAGLG